MLSRVPDTIVKMPSCSDIRFYQEVIGAKYPRYADMCASIGLKLLIQGTGDDVKQN